VGKDITGKPKKIGGFNTRTMLFHYDRRGHFIDENNKAESTLTEYIWLDDMPVTMARKELGSELIFRSGAGTVRGDLRGMRRHGTAEPIFCPRPAAARHSTRQQS
jgi:hypothetical protein